MIVVNAPEAIEKISEACGVVYSPKGHVCIARVGAGREIIGGFLYTDYNKASIHAHVAGFTPRWLNRALLWAAFDYPFNGLGVKKVILTVPERNDNALQFCYSLGFRREAFIDDVFQDGGMVVASMYWHQCRFLKPLSKVTSDGQGVRG